MAEAEKWAGDDTDPETESEFGSTPVSSNYASNFNPQFKTFEKKKDKSQYVDSNRIAPRMTPLEEIKGEEEQKGNLEIANNEEAPDKVIHSHSIESEAV